MRMTARLLATLLIRTCFIIAACLASDMSFVESPRESKTVLYPLQLNCSVENGDSSPRLLAIYKDDLGSQTVIAGLEEPDSTEVKYTRGDLYVEGSLSNQSLSSLTVTWRRPTLAQAGQYICRALNRNSDEMIQSTLNVSMEVPSFEDQLDFTRTQAAVVEEQGALLLNMYAVLKEQQELLRNTSNEMSIAKAELSRIQSGGQASSFQELLIASNEQQAQIERQESEVRNIATILNYQGNSLKTATNEIATVKAGLDKLQPRMLEGRIHCGFLTSYKIVPSFWKGVRCGPFLEKNVTVLFPQQFPRPPFVTLQLSGLGTSQTGNGTRYMYEARAVSTAGFQVVCRTWCGSKINFMRVTWQAKNN